ncbi:MAG TPA: 50S ribosomal protein L23 [Methanomicrobiales archaeon]|nr:50S ribosomal protein L23 [Methanomicrobiales archaeon]HXW98732.1 50S ribosomal protein L23 [Methanomicrobiales archaeon]
MILRYPFVTEKAMMTLERDNTLQFLVAKEATKPQIRREIEKTFEKEVASVRTLMSAKGEKKAIISFVDEKAAEEILSRLGIM